MGLILGAIVGGLTAAVTLFILSQGAKKMIPDAQTALAQAPAGMTLEELGAAVGLTGTFQRGKLQQLANHLVAQGLATTETGADGVSRFRAKG